MRFIFILFFGVLLREYHSNAFTTSVNNGCIATTNNTNQFVDNSPLDIQNDNGQHKKQLTELNIDVLTIILDHLNVGDLMNLAEVNTQFAHLAIEHFRHRHYSEIRFNDFLPANKGVIPKFEEYTDKSIHIADFEFAQRMIRHFGPEIKRIHIGYSNEHQFESSTIAQLINKHCESLTHLHLRYTFDNFFRQFSVPFKAVEELGMEISQENVECGILPFNELFPNLRQLHLIMYETVNFHYIICEFPNLEFLRLTILDIVWQQRDQIEAFLRKNAHIRSVSVYDLPHDHLEIINEFLPKIENFTVGQFFIGNDTVQFKNVKHFSYICSYYKLSSVAKISFPQLQSLQLKYSSLLANEWFEFFKKHNHMQRVHFEVGRDGIDRMTELIAELTNLLELTIECSDTIHFKRICGIVDSNKQLVKFRFLPVWISKNDLNSMRQRFENEWHVEDIRSQYAYGKTGLSFERKN